ncbi:hypothetical protein [Dankookia sp. P2]|uniref:hypothetical protein n=1 Tax=Dankookia sp. P2 TaxID=3423955 RepID=UPI003D6789AA
MSTFAFASVPTSLELKETPREAPASTAAGGPPSLPPLGGSMQFSVQNTNTRFARVGRFGVAPGAGAQASWLSFKRPRPPARGSSSLNLRRARPAP